MPSDDKNRTPETSRQNNRLRFFERLTFKEAVLPGWVSFHLWAKKNFIQ